jgi:hypothetical protein
LTDYSTILETYTFSDLLEINDLTEADVLEFLVEKGFVSLPEILPLEFT